MNKYTTLIALALTTITVCAGENKAVIEQKKSNISFEIEPKWQGVQFNKEGKSYWVNKEALAFITDFNNGWSVEIETGMGMKNEPDSDLEGYTEAKLRYNWKFLERWELRLGGALGVEYFMAGPGGSYPAIPFWSTEIRVRYKINDKLKLRAQYEPGSALEAKYGNTFENTFKFGFEYKLVENITLGVRYVTKFAENKTGNGVQVVLTYGF